MKLRKFLSFCLIVYLVSWARKMLGSTVADNPEQGADTSDDASWRGEFHVLKRTTETFTPTPIVTSDRRTLSTKEDIEEKGRPNVVFMLADDLGNMYMLVVVTRLS